MHSSTHKAPFEVCFGYLPKSPMDFYFKTEGEMDDQSDTKKDRRFIQKIQ